VRIASAVAGRDDPAARRPRRRAEVLAARPAADLAPDLAPVSLAEAAQLFALSADCASLVLAVSGGPDSMALLLLAAGWRDTLGAPPQLLAVTIDHGLRPESAAEAEAVAGLALRLGVRHRTLRWTGPKPSTGLQAAARAARYELLAAAARETGARQILTAHTLDDQAETVLFRLARGSGLTGLAGMATVTRLAGGLELVRPLLGLAKARLVATLAAANTGFAVDPSNADPRFTRARLRRSMPALAAEGLTAARLAVLARRAARADAALEAATDAAEQQLTVSGQGGVGMALRADGFFALPAEISLRLLGRAVTRLSSGRLALSRLEALAAALADAAAECRGGRFRRTLAGAAVSLGPDGTIVITRAPPRRTAAEKPADSADRRPARAEGPFTKRR
jgi:tRNA(Ile)-lysidine synthase